MVGMGEIAALAGSLKTAGDMAKTMIGLRDAQVFQAKAIELQSAILGAQAEAMGAFTAHSELVEKVGALEAEVARLKAWDAEKDNYELQGVGTGCVAYMLKPAMRGTEPPHWLCANCYTQGKKGFIQSTGQTAGRKTLYVCTSCNSRIGMDAWPEWL